MSSVALVGMFWDRKLITSMSQWRHAVADTDLRTVFEKFPVKTHAVVKERPIKDYLADLRHDVMNDDAAR